MKKEYYIGVDVGGTKISAALIDKSGKILLRKKYPTPKSNSRKILQTIIKSAKELKAEAGLKASAIKGIGIGIPGIVDTKKGKILVTPNLKLSGMNISARLKKSLKLRVAVGNDVDLGLLGEKWRGAARNAKDAVGMFMGTGLGGGIIINNKLLTGSFNAAAEIGHMTIDINGPKCSCGNRGCLEAFVGRWAIERDIRQASKSGKKFTTMKSKALKRAIRKKDPLISAILRRVSQIMGIACISIRHILDPQIIVLGGGVMEACGDFILPIVKKAVDNDKLLRRMPHCKVVISKLGDDAIAVGAVALIQQKLGKKIF